MHPSRYTVVLHAAMLQFCVLHRQRPDNNLLQRETLQLMTFFRPRRRCAAALQYPLLSTAPRAQEHSVMRDDIVYSV